VRNVVLILVMVIISSGCSAIKHANELMTLKAMADDQAHFDGVVQEYDDNFKLLVEAVQQGTIKDYPDQRSILENFGEPINVNIKKMNAQETNFWYYRQSVKFFDSDEVYLYFDGQGNLSDWEYLEAKK